MERFDSTYRGVIIQNDDPSQSGRVKVFVPFVHSSLLPLEKQQFDQNVNFGLFGKNFNEQNKGSIDLTEYLEALKSKLPWCPISMPITGETGNSKFNNATGLSTPSDSNSILSWLSLGDAEIGGGPSEIYEGVESKWGSGAESSGIAANPSSGSFNVDKKYNSSKGNFAIPSINTQVWVTFVDGDPRYPVVNGVAPSTLDWQQNITPSGYPGTYENRGSKTSEPTSDEVVYRNMSVKSSGAYDVIDSNTTGNEYHSEVHKSGASKTITHDGSEHKFSPGDSNNIRMGNTWEDSRGSSNRYVEGPDTSVTRGDRIKRVGTLNVSAAQGEKQILKNIDEYKTLFETKRSSGGGVFSSINQSKSGQGAPCPECSRNKQRPALNGESISEKLNSLSPIPLNNIGLSDQIANLFSSVQKLTGFGINLLQYPKTSDCKVCGGTGFSPSTHEGDFPPDERKEQIGNMYVDNADQLSTYEQEIGEGGNDITEVTKNMVISVGCAFNDCSPIRKDPVGKLVDSGIEIDETGPYTKKVPTPLIEPKHVDDLSGGTLTILANNKLALVAGAGGIKFQTLGITEFGGAITNITGEQVNISSAGEVNLGGGGRLNIESSALSLKSGGQVMIDGNLAVKSNLVCQGGAMVSGPLFCTGISGPMSLQETEEIQETYGSTNHKENKIVGYIPSGEVFSLIVTKNVAINGASIDANTVIEFKATSNIPVKSKGDGGASPDTDSVVIYPHSHLFRNIPLNLTGTPGENNKAAQGLANGGPMAPMPVKNGKTGPDPDKSFNKKSSYEKNRGATESTKNYYVEF